MHFSPEAAAELDRLADHLAGRRTAIIAAVREAVQRDPRLATGAKLPRTQFIDHLPEVLAAFEEQLRARTSRERRAAARQEHEGAEGHGLHRWQQGYNLGETIVEWRHLHDCVLAEIERYSAQKRSLSGAALLVATRELGRLLGDGVSTSAERHAQLLQAESATRAQELKTAMSKVQALGRERALVWREALHDLRGSVGVVRNASALLTHASSPERTRQHSEEVLKRGVASLSELLEELMNLARLEAGQEARSVAPFDAAELLRELCSAMRPLAASRALFLKAEGCEELCVEGDARKVRRIAQNLLLNALKYTQSGGVWIRWERSGDMSAPRWVLSVEDTGPGMPASAAPPIGHALKEATDAALTSGAERGPARATSETAADGEGIGRLIVKRLSELLDASVELDTAAGAGTTVRVSFPTAYGKGAQAAPL